MLRSIIIAFSTYSKIPMPRFEWKGEDMKYTMCAFPLVGAVVAAAELAAYVMLTRSGAGYFLTAVIMTLIPLLITGGIHMDGYMDTWDALCSYGDREKKLEILKDPHVGAFAVIHCACYIMLTTALWHELISRIGDGRAGVMDLYMVLSGFILSRILSGLLAVTLRKAKREGMLNDMTEEPDNKCRVILLLILAAFVSAVIYFFGVHAVTFMIPTVPITLCYRYMSYKRFGGITGDLAGWFLQVSELAVPVSVLIAVNCRP